MRGSPIERVSARTIAYVGLLATDSVLVAGAAVVLQLFHSALTRGVVGMALLLAALHTGCLAWWLRKRFATHDIFTNAFLQAWLLGATAFLLGGLLPPAVAYRDAPSAFPGALDQLAVIFGTIVVVGGSLLLGAALAWWFVLAVGIVTGTEATRARDGKQLLILALNICWATLAWPLFGLKVLLDFNNEFGRAGTGIVFCVALVPTIVIMRIRQERDRQRLWLRTLALAEDGDDDEGATPQFAIEPLENFADAEQIPPYLTDSRGRYGAVLVRTDATSGTREILGRVR